MYSISKLFEAFSNFKYSVPKDPEQLLFDFYFFTLYDNSLATAYPDENFIIQETKVELVNSLYTHMKSAIKFALSAEIRHIMDEAAVQPEITKNKYLTDFLKDYYEAYTKFTHIRSDFATYFGISKGDDLITARDRKIISKEDRSARSTSFKSVISAQKSAGYSDYDFGRVAEEIFNNRNYVVWSRAYGGKKWGDIAIAYQRLLASKTINDKIKWIDHCYDLMHNTSTVFNKLQLYSKGGYDWVLKALDKKKYIMDVREFYPLVSPQLKSIVAFVAKNVFGKTIQGAKVSRT